MKLQEGDVIRLEPGMTVYTDVPVAEVTGEQNLELQRNAILLINKIEALRQQLAAMTQEWDEAVRIATEMIGLAPITDADIRWAEALLAEKKHQEGLP